MNFKDFLNEKQTQKEVKNALDIEMPDELQNYLPETIDDKLSLLNFAISLQKKEVLKNENDKQSIAILNDLLNKKEKWEQFKKQETPVKKKEEDPLAALGISDKEEE